jgi:hypothetical protein
VIDVRVVILHPTADAASGPLTRHLTEARADLAERHRLGFAGARDAAGKTTDPGERRVEARVVSGPPDDRSFGARLREIVDADRPDGLVILGSGAIPLATDRDRRRFIDAAAAPTRSALANNRFSADVVAIARVDLLPDIPDLPADNALPRWLDEIAGFDVRDRRRTWRLNVDLDSPLDLVLMDPTLSIDRSAIAERLAGLRAVSADRRAEVLIAGRTSATTLLWLEAHIEARTRAFVEERGLRAASRLAQAGPPASGRQPPPDGRAVDRPPASVLGALLDRDGPASLGPLVARFADAALIDTRVLLAHRLGADEAAWPTAEDRFASDLLLHERIDDPWLRELTRSAATATIPILLGGHTLVGPGVRLVFRRR